MLSVGPVGNWTFRSGRSLLASGLRLAEDATRNRIVWINAHHPSVLRLGENRLPVDDKGRECLLHAPAQASAAMRAFRTDVDAGRLARPDYNLAAVFVRAEGLSGKHSGAMGSRSIDVLHMASALEARCTDFISFDERQRKIAAMAGMYVIPAKLARKRT